MNTKRNYILLLVTVLSLGMLLTGGTYAWLTFSPAIISGNNLNTQITCFVIDYSGDFPAPYGDLNLDGEINAADVRLIRKYFNNSGDLTALQKQLADINRDGTVDTDDTELFLDLLQDGTTMPVGGTMFPSKTDKGGLSGTVTININSSCNVSATGNIKLNVSNATSSTLLSSGALKYALYDSSDTTLLGSGTISSAGIKTLNTNSIALSQTATTYNVYVWLDGTKVSNSHLGLSFVGYIYADATQTES